MSFIRDKSRRRRWAISLQAMMLSIGILALALGWESQRRRRIAVDGLLAVIPTGILLEVGPSSPRKDPTLEADRGRFLATLDRVKELRAEPLAVADLAESLRAARRRMDTKSMRGVLATLQWLEPRSRDALPEIIRTARGEDFPSPCDQHATQIRSLAIHVLGILAAEDDDALATMIEILGDPDPSFQRTVTRSAANELGGLGSRARKAIPALIRALDSSGQPEDLDLLRHSAIIALGRIGSEAGPAIPRLAEIARDHQDDCRLYALEALGEIGVSLNTGKGPSIRRIGRGIEPTPSLALISEILGCLLDDQDLLIRQEAREQLRRLGPLELAKRR